MDRETVTNVFREALKLVIKEAQFSTPWAGINVKHFLMEWNMANSLPEARAIIKDLIYEKPGLVPEEIHKILLACLWTINDYIPLYYIAVNNKKKTKSILSLCPTPSEVLDKMRYYACLSCTKIQHSKKDVRTNAAQTSPLTGAEGYAKSLKGATQNDD